MTIDFLSASRPMFPAADDTPEVAGPGDAKLNAALLDFLIASLQSAAAKIPAAIPNPLARSFATWAFSYLIGWLEKFRTVPAAVLSMAGGIPVEFTPPWREMLTKLLGTFKLLIPSLVPNPFARILLGIALDFVMSFIATKG